MWWLQQGDSVEVMKCVPDDSVDALVTDPPAGISFMGREWDGAKGGRDQWIAWLAGILAECRRVMKPGSYGWVWALPRTAHWTATACEDAGFAVRDVMVHVFGTGFPKSRALLKPAAEHWILIKAPGELQELRIEENRIEGAPRLTGTKNPHEISGVNGILGADLRTDRQQRYDANPPSGRWPANFALSHSDECGGVCVEDCPVKILDEQSGILKSGMSIVTRKKPASGILGKMPAQTKNEVVGDSGTASRFFYVAKPSTKERSQGLAEGARNTHTTVKSIALMRHLINLVTAPDALVLDPFCGSGSTGVAALLNGCRFVGIEREQEYVDIAMQRLSHASMSTR